MRWRVRLRIRLDDYLGMHGRRNNPTKRTKPSLSTPSAGIPWAFFRQLYLGAICLVGNERDNECVRRMLKLIVIKAFAVFPNTANEGVDRISIVIEIID